MDNSTKVGSIEYDARINTGQLKADAARSESIVKDSAKRSAGSTKAAAKDVQASLSDFTASLAAIGAAYAGFNGVKNFMADSVDASERLQASMLGLTSVANALTGDAGAARAAARGLSEDGLIPLAQSAQALKNLLASGFSVPEATQLLSGLKDQAAFNRQSFYDLGGAVVATTEGIKNGNSVLADATGTTKNLSVMAKEAGVGIDEMGSISQNTAYRQAVLNGFLQDTSRSMGDAAKLAETAAGANAAFSVQMEYLQGRVGDVANVIRQPLLQGMSDFLARNRDLVIAIGSGVVVFGALASAGLLLVRVVPMLITAIAALSTTATVALGVFGLLSLAVGVFAGVVMNKALSNMGQLNQNFDDSNSKLPDFAGALGDSAKGAAKLAKELAGINEQMARTNRQFAEDLAEMVKRMEDNIAGYTKQLDQQNASFAAASRERLAQFKKEQTAENLTHRDKVAKIQSQIDFLRRYNNASNRQQLAELEFSLARENAEHQAATDERKAQLDEQQAFEQQKHLERVSELQAQLNAERETLNRHATDVSAIRGVILLDEIDKLKRSRDEQLASLQQQKNDAVENARQTANGVSNVWSDANQGMNEQMKGLGNNMGTEMGNAFKKALRDTLRAAGVELLDVVKKLLAFAGTIGALFTGDGMTALIKNKGNVGKTVDDMWRKVAGSIGGEQLVSGRAKGGPVSAGQPYVVGEEGMEMFVPGRSGTIVPHDQLSDMVGGRSPINVTVNMSGIMTSSPADERQIAQRLIERINESLRSKGIAELGVA